MHTQVYAYLTKDYGKNTSLSRFQAQKETYDSLIWTLVIRLYHWKISIKMFD